MAASRVTDGNPSRIQSMAALQIIEQILEGHACSPEYGCAPQDSGVLNDHVGSGIHNVYTAIVLSALCRLHPGHAKARFSKVDSPPFDLGMICSM